MRVSSNEPDHVRSLAIQLADARKQLTRQRGALLSLEQELKRTLRLRGDVCRVLVLLNEGRGDEARRKLTEVLDSWLT